MKSPRYAELVGWWLRSLYTGPFFVEVEDGVGQMVNVDVDLLHALGSEKLETVLDYRLVYDRGHGLGHLAGQWEEPGPLPAARIIAFTMLPAPPSIGRWPCLPWSPTVDAPRVFQ